MKGFFAPAYATAIRYEERLDRLDELSVKTQYDGEIPDLIGRVHALQDEWVGFELDPVHVVTWDNSKRDPERLPEPSTDGPNYNYGYPDDAGATQPNE